jgi:parallel beta-helix repeat protein
VARQSQSSRRTPTSASSQPAASPIRDNEVVGNGDGIVFTGRANRVTGNFITAVGCGDECGIGISFEGGTDNVISHNRIKAPRQYGINLGGNGGNALIGNVVIGAGEDAYNIATEASEPLDPSIIRGNRAIGLGR